jgi:hypothetical protein
MFFASLLCRPAGRGGAHPWHMRLLLLLRVGRQLGVSCALGRSGGQRNGGIVLMPVVGWQAGWVGRRPQSCRRRRPRFGRWDTPGSTRSLLPGAAAA